MKTLFERLSKEHQEALLAYEDCAMKSITLRDLQNNNFVCNILFLTALNLDVMLNLGKNDYLTISLLFNNEN
jgi:hypothetical protein